jgi:PAS domain S-box-containing protein
MPEEGVTILAASMLDAVSAPVWAVDASLKVFACNTAARMHPWTEGAGPALRLYTGGALDTWLIAQISRVLVAQQSCVFTRAGIPGYFSPLPFGEITFSPLDQTVATVILAPHSQNEPAPAWPPGDFERSITCLNCQKYLDNAPDGLLVFDHAGRIYETNRAASRMFGHAELALTQMLLAGLVAVADHARLFGLIQQLEPGAETVIDLQGMKADGREFFFQLSIARIEESVFLGFATDITERRHAEEALAHSVAFSRAILDTSYEAIIIANEHGIITDCNPATERIFGYRSDELIGRNISMLMPPATTHDHDQYITHLAQDISQQNVGREREELGKRKDRSLFPITIHLSKVEQDGHLAYTAYIRDVSDRKRYEEQIKQSNISLKTIIHSTPFGIVLVDDSLHVMEINHAALEMMNAGSAKDILGEPASRWFTGLEPDLQLVMESRGQVAAERELIRQDGRAVPILQAEVFVLVMGRPVRLVSFVDISERKRSEEYVRLMALFAELNPEPIMRFDLEGTIVMANAAAAEAFSMEQLPGRNLIEVLPEMEGFDGPVLIQTGAVFTATATFEERIYRMVFRGVPELLSGQVYATDITPIVQARRVAESANRAKGQFLANMSHELRTPLTVINGFSEVLLEEGFGKLNSDQQRYITQIRKSGQHLLMIINDLLDLARIETGKLELERIPINLATVCQEAAAMISQKAQERHLTMRQLYPDQPAAYLGDPLRLKQVMLNLLYNAVKFTRRGGITLALSQTEEQYEIRVADTGMGISQENQLRLFRPFEQVHEKLTTAEEGTGLGLALSREIVEGHGGRIWVESELGKGSCFIIALPKMPQPDN